MNASSETNPGPELASWRDTATRRAIIDFVAAVTEGPSPVPLPDRVAVFDNDGTLWTEKPMPTQLHYIVRTWAATAKADPSLADTQPYRAAVTGDLSWLAGAVDKHYAGDDADLRVMIGALVGATDQMTVEAYEASVSAFLSEASHPTLRRPYRDAVYQPMLELLQYLEAHGFTCYIVSGGDRDFMRPITVDYYGIPAERVVGSALGLEYDAEANEVRHRASFDFMNDGPEKPVRIWTRIGRRPILAVGNSNGDVPMLRYALGSPLGLSLLIHHDDDAREDTAYDRGAEDALAAAPKEGFTLVSVKDDWSSVFRNPVVGGAGEA
ncbi:HAD family hydrolase [Plantibacter sp. Mn2098]|uniref:HAD family hydrolase n=1 Tax=Plantibacter sp. Mn2098 TaxID=3395266 RepID=UPI003BC29C0F